MEREQALKVTDWYYGEFIVDQDDIVMRHGVPEFDHLRLHLYEEAAGLCIKSLFMPDEALTRLEEHGIPVAYLDEPTLTTEKVYTDDQVIRWERKFSSED